MSDYEVIESYSDVIKELKQRGVVRTKNIVGDLGEYLAMSHYSNTPGLPNLSPAATNTKNIDAISNAGDRYSIKSTTRNTTGVFYGLNPPGTDSTDDKKFEYVLIVILNDDYKLKKIIELTWEQFLHLKRWHSRMLAWNLSINSKLSNIGKIVFEN